MLRPAALRLLAATAAATALVAGCSSSGGGGAPDWRPSPTNPAIEGPDHPQISPILPGDPGLAPGGSRSAGPSGAPSSAPRKHTDPRVVATHLVTPVGLALLPDGTALVGERTTGRIVRVQPVAGRKVRTVRTLPGLDTHGDGGLLDLAVSPTYDEDGLVYAYITTRTDNRVVEFQLHGPVTPVFTGIPKGHRDNAGRLLFAPDGSLFVGTGDAGQPALAEKPGSLAGKILHVSVIGQPARTNPRRGSAVYAGGLHLVDGLCSDAQHGVLLQTEDGAGGGPDEVNQIHRGGDYGWPRARGTEVPPLGSPPSGYGSIGGCAVEGGRVWIASRDGEALLSTPLLGSPSSVRLGGFQHVLRHVYGRLETVVAAPDGALWLTTTNRDGHGTPVPTDERVIRYVPNPPPDGSRI